MADQTLRYGSIDDYLGPSHGRFFGSGFRRATYRVDDVVVKAGGGDQDGAQATVNVAYPADWSRKVDNVDLRPHLSTMDMFVLGAALGEAHLTHAYGLDDAMRQLAWLRKVTLRAGTVPQEDLTDLDGTARLIRTTADATADGSFVSVYDCRIGAMRARCEIVHPIARTDVGDGKYASLEQLLGEPEERYYGDGFKSRQHQVRDVRVDLAALSASAKADVEPVLGSIEPLKGLGGGYQPAWSMLDCFVVCLQLSQIMMYELDQVRREDSNTLWMLKTVLECARPQQPLAGAAQFRAAISEKHLVPLNGGLWRNVTIAGDGAGTTMRASFAHELPADAYGVAAA